MSLTPIKNKLEFDKFSVYDLGRDTLMEEAHPHMLDFDEITLERVV